MISMQNLPFLREREVPEIRLQRPENSGTYWTGVEHAELLERFRVRAESFAWEVSEFRCWLSRNKRLMIASSKVEVPEWKRFDKDYHLQIGLVNSNNRRSALMLYAGVVFEQEDTPLVLHQRRIGKHSLGLYENLDKRLDESVFNCEKEMREFGAFYRVMSETQPSEVLIGKAYRKAARSLWITWNRLGEVDKFFDMEYQNKWNLFLCFCRVTKLNQAKHQLKSMYNFGQLLKEEK